MRRNFPLFQGHLDFAHQIWERHLKPGDAVIDATAGNGHDTLKLALSALSGDAGEVWAFDLQEEAVAATRLLLESQLTEKQLKRVHLLCKSHDQLPKITPKLVVYNLGYLPGGDKSITTSKECTLTSVQLASKLLAPEGLISITCYPGHSEGAIEEEALLLWSAKLPPKEWSVSHLRWCNRRKSPSLLLLQKASSQ